LRELSDEEGDAVEGDGAGAGRKNKGKQTRKPADEDDDEDEESGGEVFSRSRNAARARGDLAFLGDDDESD
jgi:hypothetical protein